MGDGRESADMGRTGSVADALEPGRTMCCEQGDFIEGRSFGGEVTLSGVDKAEALEYEFSVSDMK